MVTYSYKTESDPLACGTRAKTVSNCFKVRNQDRPMAGTTVCPGRVVAPLRSSWRPAGGWGLALQAPSGCLRGRQGLWGTVSGSWARAWVGLDMSDSGRTDSSSVSWSQGAIPLLLMSLFSWRNFQRVLSVFKQHTCRARGGRELRSVGKKSAQTPSSGGLWLPDSSRLSWAPCPSPPPTHTPRLTAQTRFGLSHVSLPKALLLSKLLNFQNSFFFFP